MLIMPSKKAQNSVAERGRLHGEIEVLKFQILFCKYLCTSYLGEIFDSSTRPFFYFGRLFILSSTNIKWKGNLSEIFGCR